MRKSTWIVAALAALLVACGGGGGDGGSEGSREPVAEADRLAVIPGQSAGREAPGVLANDRVRRGGQLTARLVSEPQFGAVMLAADGAYTYTPGPDFRGSDSFTYVASDGTRETAAAEVSITLPNVVLILVDDMGLGDLQVYNADAVVPTPSIDRLAANGIRFRQAHAPAAVCAPSRYSVMTGNYPYRGRVEIGVWDAFDASPQRLDGQSTLGDVFSAAGYQTGFIGKTHDGASFRARSGGFTEDVDAIDFSTPFQRGPRSYGFDYSFTIPNGHGDPPYLLFRNDRLVQRSDVDNQFRPYASAQAAQDALLRPQPWGNFQRGRIGPAGVATRDFDSRSLGPVLTREGVDFIERSSAEGAPFFLFFSSPQMHIPFTPPAFFNVSAPQKVNGNVDNVPVLESTPVSLRTDSIAHLDAQVGALIAALEDANELANTLLVFTSDNGPSAVDAQPGYAGIGQRVDRGDRTEAEHRNAQGTDRGVPLRGSKGRVFEGGHRVPLLVSWGAGDVEAGAFSARRVSDQLIGLNDLAATFAAMTGAGSEPAQRLDSKSFLAYLLNPTGVAVRDHLLVQNGVLPESDNEELKRAYYRYAEDGDLWKLIVASDRNSRFQGQRLLHLFNLTEDPGELHDLIGDPDAQGWLATLYADYRDLLTHPRTVF